MATCNPPNGETEEIIAKDHRSVGDVLIRSFRELIWRFRISFCFLSISKVKIRFWRLDVTTLKMATNKSRMKRNIVV